MTRTESERLADIAEAIAAIHDHLEGQEAEGVLRDALLYRFVVIGEAVKHLSPETQASAPDVQWAAVARLRDLIAHEYFRIDMDVILKLVEEDLPALEAAVTRLREES
ncbi:MAG TPA: HepT-like ribonuclease domain-containing protein [Gaiellaceae bacterium]|nr:HepT-like ribonuclease domain-containing protein [Gaiellaceae bacterium]